MRDSLQSGKISLPELLYLYWGREKNEDYNDSVPVYLPDKFLAGTRWAGHQRQRRANWRLGHDLIRLVCLPNYSCLQITIPFMRPNILGARTLESKDEVQATSSLR